MRPNVHSFGKNCYFQSIIHLTLTTMAANNEKPADKNDQDVKKEANGKQEFPISTTTNLRASDPKDSRPPE